MCLKTILLMILVQSKLIDSALKYPQIYSFGGRDSNDTFLASVSRLDSLTGEWQTIATMPTGRHQFCGAAIGTKLYLFGGLKGNHTRWSGSRTADLYDSSTNTFTRLRSMPQRREGCGAAVLNGFVYVAGGWDGRNSLSSVIRYDVHTDQWSTVSSMSTRRVGLQLVHLHGYLFAIGGKGLNTVEKYDPETDQWSFVASTSANHQYSGATAYGCKIYVCSQYGFEVYDSTYDQWASIVAPNYRTYYGRSLVSMNGLLWAIGGAYKNGNQPEVSQSTFSYTMPTGRWTRRLDMDVGRMFHLSLMVDPSPKLKKSFPKLYVFGGVKYNSTLASASRYNSATGEWESINSMSTPRSGFCGVVVGRKIYLFGGYMGRTVGGFSLAIKQVEVYDTLTDTYTVLRPMPDARRGCGAAELNGYIYIAGGSTSTSGSFQRTYSSVLRYHIQTNRWSAVSNMNSDRVSFTLLTYDGLFYAIGGQTKNSTFLQTEVYNVTTDQWSILSNSRVINQSEPYAAVHQEKIYFLSDGFEVSSSQANEWIKLSPPSRTLIMKHHSLVSMNDRLWAVGGTHYELKKNPQYREFGTTPSVHSYDPSTDRWTKQQDMDVIRGCHMAFVVD